MFTHKVVRKVKMNHEDTAGHPMIEVLVSVKVKNIDYHSKYSNYLDKYLMPECPAFHILYNKVLFPSKEVTVKC